MPKDFLYCEETDTRVYANDFVTISTYPNIKYIAKYGWYTIGGARKKNWYFVSIADKSILPVDAIDLTAVSKTDKDVVASGDHLDNGQEDQVLPGFLYCESTETKIYPNDVVQLPPYSDRRYVAKFGEYQSNGAVKQGWYFLSVEDGAITPLTDVDLNTIIKDADQSISLFPDIDTRVVELEYLVIPGTNIRLYDNDIIKISAEPNTKWIVHSGWFIYDNVQNYGWYFTSIRDGKILPASIIDLTLCTLVTVKTQGSEICDGKVVNYTRPFTLADAEILNRSFITLDSLEQRDNLDKKKLINGKMVRVNNVEGPASYYAWNAEKQSWEFLEVFGIPELVGTTGNPIILSELESGLYRVKGTYKISPAHPTTYLTAIDHLAFVAEGEDVNIKVITEHNITDYIVEGDEVTFVNNYATVKYVEENYATKVYVDNKIAVIEAEISEIISEFPEKVEAIVYEVLGEALNGIEEEYIDNLFN